MEAAGGPGGRRIHAVEARGVGSRVGGHQLALGFAFEVVGGWNQQRGNRWSWLVPRCV